MDGNASKRDIFTEKVADGNASKRNVTTEKLRMEMLPSTT